MNRVLTLRLLYRRDGARCHYCGIDFPPVDDIPLIHDGRVPKDYPTIDHVLAIADGGMNDLDNLVVACAACNSRKGSRAMRAHNERVAKFPQAPALGPKKPRRLTGPERFMDTWPLSQPLLDQKAIDLIMRGVMIDPRKWAS